MACTLHSSLSSSVLLAYLLFLGGCDTFVDFCVLKYTSAIQNYKINPIITTHFPRSHPQSGLHSIPSS